MAVGGSIESISIAGRYFAVAADSDSQRNLGGASNEVQPNGDGATARTIKTKMAWSISDINVAISDDAGDHEFLQDLADGNADFPMSITYASGEVYQGTGQITGEIQLGNQAQTASISLSGPGKLTKQ